MIVVCPVCGAKLDVLASACDGCAGVLCDRCGAPVAVIVDVAPEGPGQPQEGPDRGEPSGAADVEPEEGSCAICRSEDPGLPHHVAGRVICALCVTRIINVLTSDSEALIQRVWWVGPDSAVEWKEAITEPGAVEWTGDPLVIDTGGIGPGDAPMELAPMPPDEVRTDLEMGAAFCQLGLRRQAMSYLVSALAAPGDIPTRAAALTWLFHPELARPDAFAQLWRILPKAPFPRKG